jgi:hypothetical protein
MRTLIFTLFILFINSTICNAQDDTTIKKKHGVVWSAGVFKAWLMDNSVEFNKIGDRVTPVFVEENKTGFAIQSHYMYQATKWLGVGAHAGIGLDVNSYIEAPVLLFGASVSLGNNHQFIIDFGLADGKRRVVPDNIRNDLINANLTEIPEIYNHTEFNTEFYIGVSYRIF